MARDAFSVMVDGAAILVPGVPGGASWVNLARKGVQAGKAIDSAINFYQGLQSGAAAYEAYQKGDYRAAALNAVSAGLGTAHLIARSGQYAATWRGPQMGRNSTAVPSNTKISDNASAPSNSKWNLWDDWDPKIRGRVIEKLFGRNLPKDFPGIDRFDGGLATSIKSIDLADKSYRKISHLRSTLKGYLEDLDRFNGRKFDGVAVKGSDIIAKELLVVIPGILRYRPTKAQLSVITEIEKLASQKNIRVVVAEFNG